jgi:hypothetical protein
VLPGYRVFDHHEDRSHGTTVGFRGIALLNETTKNVIIIYRGTDPTVTGNVAVDLGMFLVMAGDDPFGVGIRQVVDFAEHYGNPSYIAAANAALSSSKLYAMATGGAAAAAASTERPSFAYTMASALAFKAVCTAASLGEVHSIEHLKEHTLLITKHADRFYETTRQRLIDKGGTRPSGLGSRLGYAVGFWKDPNGEAPGGYTVTVAGHSLGGFLAQMVAVKHSCVAVAFEAPGAFQYAKAIRWPMREVSGITNYCRPNDVVSNFGIHLGARINLPCNFYDDPGEGAELQRIYDERAGKLMLELEQTFPARQAAYPEKLAQYKRDHHDYYTSIFKFGKKVPVKPEEPLFPTLENTRALADWRFGRTNQERAMHTYEPVSSIINNHGMDRIIALLRAPAPPPAALPGPAAPGAAEGPGAAERPDAAEGPDADAPPPPPPPPPDGPDAANG